MGKPEELTRVLVVEDNPTDARLVHLMLDQYGSFQSRTVGRVHTALEAVVEWKPDVVLLDLGLPDAKGLEAVERLVSGKNLAPLVVLTGVDDEDLALEALQRGAQDYLTKNDLTPRMLHRVLRYAIERQRLVDELQQARERVETLSRLDPLTGLLNRRGLEHELQREQQRSHRDGQSLQVVAWDLDDFKSVNDTLGHTAGDVLLAELARRARQVFRSTDIVARVGGDEFMAVLPATRAAEGIACADRLRALIASTPFVIEDQEIFATISVGLAELHDEDASFESLLRVVDGELYRSKRAGKNKLSLATDEAPTAKPTGVDLTKVDLAVRAEPLTRLGDDAAPQAYEILSRATLRGLEPPREYFLACREQSCLASADLRSLELCVEASAAVDPDLPCHVNIFPSTLLEVGATEVVRRLERARRNFCVDLSEEQIVGDPTPLLPVVEPLRRAGYQLGVDHIGSRRSSLEAMLVLEPDVVKVDVSWSRNLSGVPRRQRELARLLRLLAVAGCTIVLPRPRDRADRWEVSRICGELGLEPIWSDPDRSIELFGRTPVDGSTPAVTPAKAEVES